ncbi:hypothetical protein T07_12124 [Trichinella nelsoni]|uniref:Uncharacterized protein n=1 Tax=Trichinella nelsoni TaxID=6336 RepID=A0A0V0RG63_9BILA|nr:hypothetical protein T07_12124 [Trichinella nelsoni]
MVTPSIAFRAEPDRHDLKWRNFVMSLRPSQYRRRTLARADAGVLLALRRASSLRSASDSPLVHFPSPSRSYQPGCVSQTP